VPRLVPDDELVAAQAVGGIAGGMVAAAYGRRMRPGRLLSYGAVAFGLVAGLAMLIWLRAEPAGSRQPKVSGRSPRPAVSTRAG